MPGMRLYLLPISTRRTLLYCQQFKSASTNAAHQQSYLDKVTHKAAELWAGWEKKESGWQKQVVTYGNKALKRISYEEWGLKSMPPLNDQRIKDAEVTKGSVEVAFPKSVIPESKVLGLLKKLGTDRQQLHKSRLLYCVIGMPISAPFALVPIVPNIPFFYLAYRAFSHWRALYGSKHIMFLLEKNLLEPTPSPVLEELYEEGIKKITKNAALSTSNSYAVEEQSPDNDAIGEMAETMVLSQETGKLVAETLEIPELYIELERAIWQVEESMKAEQMQKAESAKAATNDKVQAMEQKNKE